MPSPEPYRDDDRPRPGSPRLYGDVSGLAGVPTGRMRHRKPSESKAHRMHLYLVIAACHDAGLSAKIVADQLGLSDRHVRRVYLLKVKARSRLGH